MHGSVRRLGMGPGIDRYEPRVVDRREQGLAAHVHGPLTAELLEDARKPMRRIGLFASSITNNQIVAFSFSAIYWCFLPNNF